VVHLQASSIDDCLELFDLLMVTELLGKAKRETDKQRAREHPMLARASVKLAAAVRMLLAASKLGRSVDLEEVWRAIEQVVPRAELELAVATVGELVPFAAEDDEGEIRGRLAERIRLVSVFLHELTEVIEFGAAPEGAPVLDEMRRLPALLGRRRLKAGDINERLVHGSWRRLVYRHPAPTDDTVDRNAYAFCVLTQFHRQLMRRETYAPGSSRWRDPRAQLLAGDAWANAKDPALTALSLPENPGRLLDQHARKLDAAYRQVTPIGPGHQGRRRMREVVDESGQAARRGAQSDPGTNWPRSRSRGRFCFASF